MATFAADKPQNAGGQTLDCSSTAAMRPQLLFTNSGVFTTNADGVFTTFDVCTLPGTGVSVYAFTSMPRHDPVRGEELDLRLEKIIKFQDLDASISVAQYWFGVGNAYWNTQNVRFQFTREFVFPDFATTIKFNAGGDLQWVNPAGEDHSVFASVTISYNLSPKSALSVEIGCWEHIRDPYPGWDPTVCYGSPAATYKLTKSTTIGIQGDFAGGGSPVGNNLYLPLFDEKIKATGFVFAKIKF